MAGAGSEPGRASRLGVYEGYSSPVADGYARFSLHVPMEDGCRIAVDVLRPARGGEPLAEPAPTVVRATGYRRAWVLGEPSFNTALGHYGLREHRPGDRITVYEFRPLLRRLCQHGYNLVSLDLRGTGASFGQSGFRNWRDAADVAQVVDWIAAQPWSDGRVGMHGISWEALIQICTAVYEPAALRCLVPVVPATILNVFEGGLFLEGFARDWTALRKGQDRIEPALPVDGEEGSALLEAALAERGKGIYLWDGDLRTGDAGSIHHDFSHFTRDVSERVERTGAPMPPHPELGALKDHYRELERFNRAGVPTYVIGGWWDVTFAGDYIDFFRAIEVPKRLLLGPWNHGSVVGTDAEIHRWLDYWLKGIDNGIMDEAPVHYGASDRAERIAWRAAPSFPPPEVTARPYYLAPAGTLAERAPTPGATTEYVVDYAVTLGERSRSRHLYRTIPIELPDLAARAERCLAYTSAPLAEGLEIAGRPVLYLTVSSSVAYAAVFATLEEVDAAGRSEYLTEGYLNLEHRKVAPAPRGHLEPGYHSLHAADRLPVAPDEALDVVVELFPVAHRVTPGTRLRLTVAGADAGNLRVAVHEPAPRLRLHHRGEAPARIELPVRAGAEPQAVAGAFEGQTLIHGIARCASSTGG